MAALTRPTTASWEIHEDAVVNTLDNEDHTFCGVMFPVRAKEDLPVCRIIVRSVAVRGHLGPMSVWVTKEGVNTDNRAVRQLVVEEDRWTKLYERDHKPSPHTCETLDFSNNPIVLLPGETRMIYVHSKGQHDQAIVYDNAYQYQLGGPRYEDSLLSIHTGRAHLSPEPFGEENIWGWGSAWREHREFVGKLHYGAVYQLWQPELHPQFGNKFQEATHCLLGCQRRWESPMSLLPDECVFYILNMCRWDWFNDSDTDMVKLRQRREQRQEQQQQQQQQAEPDLHHQHEPMTRTMTTRAGSRRWRFGYSTIRGTLAHLAVTQD